jgi:AmmeMemoRadiSam system protein B
LKALVAPHIDLRLGGPTYTHAYRALAESQPPDLFVILGTGHMGVQNFFSISPKDFETPLGIVETDTEFYECFYQDVGSDTFGEELIHRNEHTIEFQLLFLQHILDSVDFKILPVLASFSYADLVEPGRSLESSHLISSFVGALRTAEAATGRRVCVIASVDLAHIGMRYGDNVPPTPWTVEHVMKKDLEMLNHVREVDANGFSKFVIDEKDERRICGFPCLFTLLNYLSDSSGELLSHSHCQIDESGSFVTYASLVFR